MFSDGFDFLVQFGYLLITWLSHPLTFHDPLIYSLTHLKHSRFLFHLLFTYCSLTVHIMFKYFQLSFTIHLPLKLFAYHIPLTHLSCLLQYSPDCCPLPRRIDFHISLVIMHFLQIRPTLHQSKWVSPEYLTGQYQHAFTFAGIPPFLLI